MKRLIVGEVRVKERVKMGMKGEKTTNRGKKVY